MADRSVAKHQIVARLIFPVRACLLAIFMFFAPGVATSQAAGSVHGVVRDSLGGVVASARITVRGSAVGTTSDSAGGFRLGRVQPGATILEVRRLGYRPASASLTIEAGGVAEVDIELAPVAEQLAPVQVLRRPEAYESRLAGFNERKTKHVGYFVTREKLDRMNSSRFVDAIREIPGVSLRTLRGGVATVSLRGARCAPVVYIDGFPATAGTMDLDMLDLSGVEGIEIYAGMSSIPPEFMSVVGGERCGVIAVWSRATRPRKQRAGEMREVDLEKLIASSAVYTVFQVDTPAQIIGRAPEPVYPDSLWKARVAGRVVAEFVVDTAGDVEPESIHIVSTTQPYFAAAVTASLGALEFRPARLGGQSVRQLVLLPFVFTPDGEPARPGPPD
jgi:hypothetical protein